MTTDNPSTPNTAALSALLSETLGEGGPDLYYVANAYLSETPPARPTDRDSIVVLASEYSTLRAEHTAATAALEKVRQERDELQAQRRDWLDNDIHARVMVKQEGIIEKLEAELSHRRDEVRHLRSSLEGAREALEATQHALKHITSARLSREINATTQEFLGALARQVVAALASLEAATKEKTL